MPAIHAESEKYCWLFGRAIILYIAALPYKPMIRIFETLALAEPGECIKFFQTRLKSLSS